jgi:beta-N-acetylhexosaminidase
VRHSARTYLRRLLFVCLALVAILPGASEAQSPDYSQEAQRIFDEMSVEERIGQLFLVPILGDSVDRSSDIADLILTYRVGGVILLAEHNNMGQGANAISNLVEMANRLQLLSVNRALPPEPDVEQPLLEEGQTEEPAQETGSGLPLLIATAHDGDGPPHTEIRTGLTPLPSTMAIGATWNENNSRIIGAIAGRELASLGINMLLGPSLDVLEDSITYRQNDLGNRAFGGDPFWVGLMGRAYTEGVHQGSDGRLAVIGKHFPGYGSSDRAINEEVGTVRKSLEQLKQIELAPFFAVTGGAPGQSSTVDGLLSAHIRYQGFQGNIRSATAPVSFDPQALSTLMQLPEFSGWRDMGGVIVSDSLGVRAVQRFYDDTGQEFPHRLVAKDALLAGNDLLMLTEFGLGDAPYGTQLANIKDTILWFRDKYETDQTFQQRADVAVRRIIQLKLRLYQGDMSIENVLVDGILALETVGLSQAAVFDVAQQAITLISPTQSEVMERIPPGPADDLVIFTDVRTSRQCDSCPSEPWIDAQALEERILALYGPEGSDQIRASQISSFTFRDLSDFLNLPPERPALGSTGPVATPTPSPTSDEAGTAAPSPTPSTTDRVELALNRADWLIFALLEPDHPVAGSDALSRFLADRPDIVRNANIVVFAFESPYFLDTTEISQLTAYVGVYSKVGQFINAAVRVLFGESPLAGRPPVDIDGIAYDLFRVTQPDPNQVIELFIVDQNEPRSPPRQEPLEVVPGATLKLQTGVIFDYNGNPVPDGTPIQFIQQDRIQGFVNVIAERPTQGGIANLDYLLDNRSGNFRITAAAGQARASEEVDIVIGENAIVSVNTPTPAPSFTPAPTRTPTATMTPTLRPSPTASATPTATPTAEAGSGGAGSSLADSLGDLVVLLAVAAGMALAGVVAYLTANNHGHALDETVRQILWSQVGALALYDYLALRLPGAAYLDGLGAWAGLLVTVGGGLISLRIYQWLQPRGHGRTI